MTYAARSRPLADRLSSRRLASGTRQPPPRRLIIMHDFVAVNHKIYSHKAYPLSQIYGLLARGRFCSGVSISDKGVLPAQSAVTAGGVTCEKSRETWLTFVERV
jgi:hypothetical protein